MNRNVIAFLKSGQTVVMNMEANEAKILLGDHSAFVNDKEAKTAEFYNCSIDGLSGVIAVDFSNISMLYLQGETVG